MRLRELLLAALLGMLLGAAYGYVQHSDEEAAARERATWSAKVDR